IIPLLLGCVGLVKDRFHSIRAFWPLILILLINTIPLINAENFKNIARLFQVFLMINFSILISKYWRAKHTSQFSRATFVLALIFLLIEIIFYDHQGLKNFLSF